MKAIYIFFAGILFINGVSQAQWSSKGVSFKSLPWRKTIDSAFRIGKINTNLASRFEFAGTDNTFYGTGAGSSAGAGSSYNCAFGYNALPAITSSDCSAFGASSLQNNTSGEWNTAIGAAALYTNVSGSYNTAVGVAALHGNTASYNIAMGHNALYSNTTGTGNIGIGVDAGYDNTTGTGNTAVGYEALYNNTATNCTALGNNALLENTAGTANTAVGANALYSNTTGSQNSAFGPYALYSNTSGYYNVALGSSTLYYNTTGIHDVACGYFSLADNTSGICNSAYGFFSLYNNDSGSQNVGIGDSALYNNTTGSNNTGVGYNAGPASSSTNLSNSTAIGNGATTTASNQVVIGNSSVTSIGGYVAWTNFSDGRFKKNIQDNVPGLAFIKLLRPITYNLDINGVNSFSHDGKTSNTSATDQVAIRQKEKITYTGFVAQEVETAAKKVNYDFSGVAVPQNDKDLYGLRYSDFVAPLVKAVQDLSNTNDSLKLLVDSLKTVEANLQSQVNNIVQQLSALKVAVLSDAPILKQNEPNPFTTTTTINYYLSSNIAHAQLTITDAQGRILKDVVLSNSKGPGQAILNAGELASGVYFYSLVINGKNIDTKKMVLTK